MSTNFNFLSLPGELRNRIYKLTPGLLRTSKTVHREASSLLYSQNRFDFTEVSLKMAASFLEKIGRINANSIRHIILLFPTVCLDPHDDYTFKDDRVPPILAMI